MNTKTIVAVIATVLFFSSNAIFGQLNFASSTAGNEKDAVAAGVITSDVSEATASCPGTQARCTCAVATGGWNSGVLKTIDLGCMSVTPLNPGRPKRCSKACSDQVSGNIGILGGATAACQMNGWASGCIRGYGYIGSIGTNNVDGTVGKITCNAPIPPVTSFVCPSGWIVDTNGPGANDCKKVACQPITATPLPPNNTPIGTWGFVWGNAIWQWGSGSTVIITPGTPGSGTFGPC